jgi:hypothetical protein
VKILNELGHVELEGEGYCIRSGIVVVMKGAIIPNGTVI